MKNIRWLDSAELDLTNIIRYVEESYAIGDGEIIVVLVWNNQRDDSLISVAIESAE